MNTAGVSSKALDMIKLPLPKRRIGQTYHPSMSLRIKRGRGRVTTYKSPDTTIKEKLEMLKHQL